MILTCKKCGGKTNSALVISSLDVDFLTRESSRCVVRVTDSGWEIGCSWGEADDFLQSYIRQKLIDDRKI